MSDILIKNMDKPKSCFSDYKRCPFEVTSINSKEHYCSLTGDRVFRAKIKSNCPIVEVRPHGELVNLGDVYEAINREIVPKGIFLSDFYKAFADIPIVLEANNE